MIELLSRRDIEHGYSRNAPSEQARAAVQGPQVLLADDKAGSGGDNLALRYKMNHLGPVIGERTWGGLIGISDSFTLVDGGSVSSPETAFFNPETNEIISGNHGIDPEIEVDRRPDLVVAGHDPQLERAVDLLLEKLKSVPPKKSWNQPPYRVTKAKILP